MGVGCENWSKQRKGKSKKVERMKYNENEIVKVSVPCLFKSSFVNAYLNLNNKINNFYQSNFRSVILEVKNPLLVLVIQ